MDSTIIDLLRPHTGTIEHTGPAPAGFGAATTGLVEASHGRFFVKATPQDSRDLKAARREAAINSSVQPVSPAIRWQAENDDWFVLGFEAVEGRSVDFLPGSADLPLVIDIVNRVSAHTDIYGRNVLVGDDQSWLVDWEWPTVGAAAIMPSCLAVQLVSSGHSPKAPEHGCTDGSPRRAQCPGRPPTRRPRTPGGPVRGSGCLAPAHPHEETPR